MIDPPPYLIFTDLDGTLLDAATYSYTAAEEALRLVRERNIPVIFVSSKTRAEIEPLRARLHNTDPFIIENGGGVFIPTGYFEAAIQGAQKRGGYDVVELGESHARLRAALQDIGKAVGCRLSGFGDMSAQEIAERTGLTREQAGLARQREYDEPFLIEGGAESDLVMREIHRQAETRGLRCTRGGRFFHLMGRSDKGRACRLLMEAYGVGKASGGRPVTVGIGDSLNDLPMLAAVDRPIVVQRPDGTFDPDLRLEKLARTPAVGPAGWNRAVLDLLRTPHIGGQRSERV